MPTVRNAWATLAMYASRATSAVAMGAPLAWDGKAHPERSRAAAPLRQREVLARHPRALRIGAAATDDKGSGPVEPITGP